MTGYTSQTRVLVVCTNFVDPDRLPAENRQDQTVPKVLVAAKVQDSWSLGHFEREDAMNGGQEAMGRDKRVQENLDQKVRGAHVPRMLRAPSSLLPLLDHISATPCSGSHSGDPHGRSTRPCPICVRNGCRSCHQRKRVVWRLGRPILPCRPDPREARTAHRSLVPCRR